MIEKNAIFAENFQNEENSVYQPLFQYDNGRFFTGRLVRF